MRGFTLTWFCIKVCPAVRADPPAIFTAQAPRGIAHDHLFTDASSQVDPLIPRRKRKIKLITGRLFPAQMLQAPRAVIFTDISDVRLGYKAIVEFLKVDSHLERLVGIEEFFRLKPDINRLDGKIKLNPSCHNIPDPDLHPPSFCFRRFSTQRGTNEEISALNFATSLSSDDDKNECRSEGIKKTVSISSAKRRLVSAI